MNANFDGGRRLRWPCVSCGYDLRGALEADPICPECGHQNFQSERDSLEHSVACWSRDAAIASMVAGIGLMFFVLATYFTFRSAFCATVILGPTGVAIFGAAFRHTGRLCRFRSGWRSAALIGALVGAACTALGLAACALTAWHASYLSIWTAKTGGWALVATLRLLLVLALFAAWCGLLILPYRFCIGWVSAHFARSAIGPLASEESRE